MTLGRFNRMAVSELLERGCRQQAFPGATALWGEFESPPHMAMAGKRGLSRNQEAISPDLIYDLASLTKVLATTSLAMIMHRRGQFDLDAPLGSSPLTQLAPLPTATPVDWNQITATHLLTHQSGLRPWCPFYKLGGSPGPQRRLRALEAIWLEKPEAAPGQRTIYSDLNFILLGFWLEEIGGQPLDELFRREVAAPLGLTSIGFRPTSHYIAPTEDGFRYGGPEGHPEAALKGPTPLGWPHDDNSAYFSGVAGHAGLFAPAREAWAIAADWAAAWKYGQGRIFHRETLANFIHPRPAKEDAGRPLGFNIRRGVESMAGSALPPEAVGHLGYTGTSLWWSFEDNFAWLLFTNRVHPSARNRAWKPAQFVGGPVG